jgi:hypothetical protein
MTALLAAAGGGSQSVLALIISVGLAFACSLIASRKGRNRVVWSIAGFFFSIFALAAVAILPASRARRAQLRS